jgi:hypothetical protein
VALSFITGTSFTESALGQDGTLTPANSVGNLLVCVIGLRSSVSQPSVLTVSDTFGNVWSHATPQQQATSLEVDVYYSVTTGVAGTLTVHSDKATNAMIAECLEFHSTIGWVGSVADILLLNSGVASTALTSGTSAATAQAAEVAVGFTTQFGTDTFSAQSAGYTLRTSLSSPVTGVGLQQQTAYQILSATGAQLYAATSNNSAIWGAGVCTFKEAALAGLTGSGNTYSNRGGNDGGYGTA